MMMFMPLLLDKLFPFGNVITSLPMSSIGLDEYEMSATNMFQSNIRNDFGLLAQEVEI